MRSVELGASLLNLVRTASDRVVIVAPYIKAQALRRVIAEIPPTVDEFLCVTRWLPEDIATGVCDLEIYEDVLEVSGGQLRVQPHLHAKYYAAGGQALVGSANLTARGLGWHTPSNLELLVQLPWDFPGLSDWETLLLHSSIPATEELRDRIRAEAEEYRRTHPTLDSPDVERVTAQLDSHLWVPRCSVPGRLWEVYRGRGADSMVTSAYEAARADLASLELPQGLTESLFTAYITGILRQMPILVEIDKLANSGLSDAAACALLNERLGEDSAGFSAAHAWRVIKQWLEYFFPHEYRRETQQEVLVKGRELHSR